MLTDVGFGRVLCDRTECDETEGVYLSCNIGGGEALDEGERARFGSRADVGEETIP